MDWIDIRLKSMDVAGTPLGQIYCLFCWCYSIVEDAVTPLGTTERNLMLGKGARKNASKVVRRSEE